MRQPDQLVDNSGQGTRHTVQGPRSPMEDANPQHRPYVLWFDTLPDGSTAKVYVYPRLERFS